MFAGVLGIPPAFSNIILALGTGLTAVEMYALKENNYEQLFRKCGIVNPDDKIPLVIKKQKKGNTTTLVVHMPEGISQKHFEQKQLELEQGLNSKVEFSFNKNLIIKLTQISLGINIPYVFEPCDKPLEVFCGYSNAGKFTLDLEKCPHSILAGETGSGKTSLLDVIILSLLQSSHDIDLHLIDFQCVGLGKYESCNKVKSYGETPEDFERLLDELEQENRKRLKLFRSVKNKIYIDKLSTWNEQYPKRALPYKVVIVDEFAKLADDRYKPILERFRGRASMDRKTGIHYLISMQRPDVKCIEGSIKANMPTRIAFKTVTETDSRVILDIDGAEKLKNPGRFIAKYFGELTEAQSMYIPSDKIMKFLKQHDLFKPHEDTYFKAEAIEERQNKIREFHKNNNNPY